MTPAKPLRFVLLANALFATTTGAVIAFAPAAVAEALGIEPHPLLMVLAVGLLVFALDLIHQATRRQVHTWRAMYATALDLGWVAATIAVLATSTSHLSATGVTLVSSVGIVVLAFAIGQLWAIDAAHRIAGTRLRTHCVNVYADVPTHAMWRVVSDLGAIHRFMPSLSASGIENGSAPAVGAVRHCTDRRGRTWSEECTTFEPGVVELRFRADVPGFPFPASAMDGGWKVTPHGRGTRVTVWWELQPRPHYLSAILMPVFAFAADRQLTTVVRHMAAAERIRHDGSSANDRDRPAPAVRMLHEPCSTPRAAGDD